MSYLGSAINTDDYSDLNDVRISQLDYTNPATASFIIDRKSAMYNATGSNIYSATSGSSVVRFNIESPVDWLDPSSLRIQFDIVNSSLAGTNEQLFLTGGPHAFFSRLRVLSRGIVLNDITEYARVHELFSYFKSQNVKANELSESLFFTDHNGSEIQTDVVDAAATKPATPISTGIYPGERITVLFKPFCGILNQEKYIPLKYAPLTFELSIVNTAKDPIVIDGAKNYDGTAAYTAARVSEVWQLENFKVRCDLIKLDNTFQNEFDDQILKNSGGNSRLKIRFSNYISQVFSVASNGNSDLNINMTRALSNLNRVFVSFGKIGGGIDRFFSKDYNTFYSTLAPLNPPSLTSFSVKPVYSKFFDPVFSAQLSIGAKLFPEYPIQSSQEAFYMLKKSFNDDKIFNKHIHSVDIKGKSYLSDKFVLCFDTCKVNAGTAAYAGLDVRNGATINLRYKFPTTNGLVLPDSVHTVLEAESDFFIMGTFVYVAE